MTIAELIAKLKEYPQDTKIYRHTHDGLTSEPEEIDEVVYKPLVVRHILGGKIVTSETIQVLTLY